MKPTGNCVTLEPTLAGIFAFQGLRADVMREHQPPLSVADICPRNHRDRLPRAID